MPRIRPYELADRAAVADICVRTADAGADATGMFRDDLLWADVFVLPYVDRHPNLAFVVVSDDDRVVGYVVAAPDTEDFEDWFGAQWWPRVRDRYPLEGASDREGDIIRYAQKRAPGQQWHAGEYPAHLHIDLLPELQGQGFGRRLIDTLVTALERDGVTGVHLEASAENVGAVAFYPRVGFEELPSGEGSRAFARRLQPSAQPRP